MIKIKLQSLKTQLMFSYMVVCIFVLALSSILSYNTILGILTEMSRNSTIQSFQQAEMNINDFNDEVDNISKVFIANQCVQDFLDHRYSSIPDRVDIFRDFSKATSNMFIVYRYIESAFILLKDGDVIGTSKNNNWNIEGTNTKLPFYNSEGYSIAEKVFPRMVMTGNFTSLDFLTAEQKKSGNMVKRFSNTNYITAIRGIKSMYQSKQSATLVININERKLNSIYSRLTSNNDLTYIVDTKGNIISHPQINKIGTKCGIFEKIDTTKSDGSFSYKNDNIYEQVVYYSLNKTDWILVREIHYKQFINNITRLKNIILISFLSSLLIISIFYFYWINKITNPFKKLIQVMKEVGRGHIGQTVQNVPNNEVGMLIEYFNKMSVNVMELVKKNKTAEEQKRRLEVEMLQYQINPHFLYNTLNTIRWMAAVIKAKNIVESITILGELIRPIFKDTSVLYTIGEELEYLTNYLKIMSYRYDDDIKFDIHVNEELLEYKILRFILQPLIENSLIHGFRNKSLDKEIRISISEEEDMLTIAVEDNGDGIPEKNLKQLNNNFKQSIQEKNGVEIGMGLSNVSRRINLHYGEKFGINIERGYIEGTKIIVKLPKVK